MSQMRSPKRLLDYCCAYVAEKINLSASDLYILYGHTPYEMVTGDTPDISEYTDYEWYQPLWYYDHVGFPNQRRNMGRWLGVAHEIGQDLWYWILTERGLVIGHTTV
jgi:hypothetical protein